MSAFRFYLVGTEVLLDPSKKKVMVARTAMRLVRTGLVVSGDQGCLYDDLTVIDQSRKSARSDVNRRGIFA